MTRHRQSQVAVTMGVGATAVLTYVWPEHGWAHVLVATVVNLVWIWSP